MTIIYLTSIKNIYSMLINIYHRWQQLLKKKNARRELEILFSCLYSAFINPAVTSSTDFHQWHFAIPEFNFSLNIKRDEAISTKIKH